MHEVRRCPRCNLYEDFNCKCTNNEMVKYHNDEYKAFECRVDKGNWPDVQMVGYLKEQGYKVEKRKPNPKKRPRK